jgi:SAM-dependent methyltransferase
MKISSILEHPLTRGLSVDDPRTTLLRREIIQSKPFLRCIYEEWYEKIFAATNDLKGDILELGSGAGFIKELNPRVITSEILELDGVDIVADACNLPFENASLGAIVMTDVLHHIPDVELFLKESERVLQSGGRIVMIEPWNTRWSKWVYQNLHHEPFIPDATSWKIPASGPLSGANGALPWILCERDRALFQSRFPSLKIMEIEPLMPFSYLLSGGVSMRALIPGFAYQVIRSIEKLFNKNSWAMFAFIVIERT